MAVPSQPNRAPSYRFLYHCLYPSEDLLEQTVKDPKVIEEAKLNPFRYNA